MEPTHGLLNAFVPLKRVSAHENPVLARKCPSLHACIDLRYFHDVHASCSSLSSVRVTITVLELGAPLDPQLRCTKTESHRLDHKSALRLNFQSLESIHRCTPPARIHLHRPSLTGNVELALRLRSLNIVELLRTLEFVRARSHLHGISHSHPLTLSVGRLKPLTITSTCSSLALVHVLPPEKIF